MVTNLGWDRAWGLQAIAHIVRNLTQIELAERLTLAEQHVQRYEATPRLSTCNKLRVRVRRIRPLSRQRCLELAGRSSGIDRSCPFSR